MKKSHFLSATFAFALPLALAFQPAHAASQATETFLANVTPNVDFLDRASRAALEATKDRSVRAFARSQAAEQTLAANAIYERSKAADAGPLMTGRSSADGKAVRPAVDERAPRGQEDVDFLAGLEGHDFDSAYVERVSDALHQVETDYVLYIVTGDDAVLRDVAAKELPKVRRAIASLPKA